MWRLYTFRLSPLRMIRPSRKWSFCDAIDLVVHPAVWIVSLEIVADFAGSAAILVVRIVATVDRIQFGGALIGRWP